MTSKDFKCNAKTVSQNFQNYTHAMETDLQLLITSILDMIEQKVVTLRKLLKLKLCIKNFKSITDLKYFINPEDSMCLTPEKEKRCCDSLEDLSSMVFEVDKSSLPREDTQKRLKCLEDLADIEGICEALNCRHEKLLEQVEQGEDPRVALNKYIYLLLDAEKPKEKTKKAEDPVAQEIGDFVPEACEKASEESMVRIGRTEYESILDILNMVLKSYKMQEEVTKRNRTIEKTQTEPFIAATRNPEDERKIVSDSKCQQNDVCCLEKKHRSSRKNICC